LGSGSRTAFCPENSTAAADKIVKENEIMGKSSFPLYVGEMCFCVLCIGETPTLLARCHIADVLRRRLATTKHKRTAPGSLVDATVEVEVIATTSHFILDTIRFYEAVVEL
jgi:hypothetical protein